MWSKVASVKVTSVITGAARWSRCFTNKTSAGVEGCQVEKLEKFESLLPVPYCGQAFRTQQLLIFIEPVVGDRIWAVTSDHILVVGQNGIVCTVIGPKLGIILFTAVVVHGYPCSSGCLWGSNARVLLLPGIAVSKTLLHQLFEHSQIIME